MDIQLYQHQKEALKQLRDKGYKGYIALPPGMGKSLIGVMAIKEAKAKKPLIVAPKSAFATWNKELSRLGIDAYVVNYERILSNHKKTNQLPDTDFLILDEAHRVKNIKAKTTKLLMSYYGKQNIPKVLLSGTPYKHLIDLYTQFFIISPAILGRYKDYVSTYFNARENYWGGVEYEPKADAERLILQRLKGYFYRKSREDIKDIEKVDVEVDIPTPEGYSWNDFKAQIVSQLIEAGYKDEELKAELISNIRGKFITMMREAQEKNKEKMEYIADFVFDNPDTVIFTLFKDEAYRLAKLVNGYAITGQTPQKEREMIVRKQDRPIVFTQALSEGADLVGYRNIIFACIPSSTIMFNQVAGRIDRLSQKAGVLTYIYLLDEYNAKLFELLKQRRESSDYFNKIAEELIRQVVR